MSRMLVTLEVSQEEISALKTGSYLKAYERSVTFSVSQFGIVPKFVVARPYVMHSPCIGDSDKQAVMAS
jgi:hypothetical protein